VYFFNKEMLAGTHQAVPAPEDVMSNRLSVVATAIAITITITIMLPTVVVADSSFRTEGWPVLLDRGNLMVRGHWNRWTVMDHHVTCYSEVETANGLVMIYARGPHDWRVVTLNPVTGQQSNERSFKQPVTIVRGGDYGAYIQVGPRCYDYSWDMLRPVECSVIDSVFVPQT
jgi:hypothetical protein